MFFVLANKKIAEQTFEQELNRAGNDLKLNYELILHQSYEKLSSLVDFIGNNKELNALFYQAYLLNLQKSSEVSLAEVRNQLNKKLADSWQQLQNKHAVRQLHYHFGPGSTSFLRVHKPGKFGDNMDEVRHTIVNVNQQHKAVHGFETGRIYSGLRSAIPIIHTLDNGEKVNVGALEVGSSFDNVLTALIEKVGINGAVFLNRNHVEKNMWPEAIITKFENHSIGSCDCFLESATIENVSGLVDEKITQGFNLAKTETRALFFDNQHIALTSFPLYDFKAELTGGKPVGSIFLWRNINDEVATLNQSIWFNYIYGLLGYIFVEFLFLLAVHSSSRQFKKRINEQIQEINESEKRLNAAQKIAHIGSWEYNLASQTLYCSNEIFRIFEIEKDSKLALYDHLLTVVHDEDRAQVNLAYQNSLTSKKPYHIIYRLQMANGTIKYVEERCNTFFNNQGEAYKSIGTIIDITQQHLLQEKDRLASNVFRYAAEGLMVADINEIIVDINPAFCDITGYTKKEILGKPLSFLNSNKHDDSFYQGISDHLTEHSYWQGEIWKVKKSGEVYPQWLRISPIPDDKGNIVSYVHFFSDISEQKAYEQHLYEAAMYDKLTGLPNRKLILERLEQSVLAANRTRATIAVMFIDLDGFKAINDNYSHESGDAVLVNAAQKLQNQIRKTDTSARIGGDEFVILFNQVTDQQGILNIATKLLNNLNQPLEYKGNKLIVSASIGISFFNGETPKTVDMLLNEADKAMYQAKNSGKNQFAVYSDT
nr:diguanylate cyclase [Colwellia sp. E2M01]